MRAATSALARGIAPRAVRAPVSTTALRAVSAAVSGVWGSTVGRTAGMATIPSFSAMQGGRRRGGGGGRPNMGREVHPLSVFVGNIPFDVPADDLREFMSTVGTVTHVEMFTRNGMQVGSAVVEYASAEEAQRAMRELHDETFGGRMLFVRENYRASYKRDFQVLITNVPPRAAWWEIKDLVRPLAPVQHVVSHGRKALVQLEFSNDAQAVVDGLDGTYLEAGGQETQLQCSIVDEKSAMRRGFDSTDAHQLIVRNLPAYIGWQEVKDVFKEFGSCLHVRMGKDRTAMVHMAEDDVAKDALEALHESMLFGHTLNVQWRLNEQNGSQ